MAKMNTIIRKPKKYCGVSGRQGLVTQPELQCCGLASHIPPHWGYKLNIKVFKNVQKTGKKVFGQIGGIYQKSDLNVCYFCSALYNHSVLMFNIFIAINEMRHAERSLMTWVGVIPKEGWLAWVRIATRTYFCMTPNQGCTGLLAWRISDVPYPYADRSCQLRMLHQCLVINSCSNLRY